MCLEENFIDDAVRVHNVMFQCGKVQPPVAQVLIHDIDGVELELGVETRTFEYFSEDADRVDEVGEGAEDGERGEEGRVVVFF